MGKRKVQVLVISDKRGGVGSQLGDTFGLKVRVVNCQEQVISRFGVPTGDRDEPTQGTVLVIRWNIADQLNCRMVPQLPADHRLIFHVSAHDNLVAVGKQLSHR